MYAKVIINNSGNSTNREYTYIVPDSLSTSIQPGIRVMVPFGKSNKPIEGFVIDIDQQLATDKYKLKEIKKAIDDKPIIPRDLIEIIKYLKDNYLCDYMDAIKSIVPPEIRVKNSRVLYLKQSIESIQNCNLSQLEWIVVEKIDDYGGNVSLEELIQSLDIKNINKIIDALHKRDIVEIDSTSEKSVDFKFKKIIQINSCGQSIDNLSLRSKNHITVLKHLMEHGNKEINQLLSETNCSIAVIKTLEKKGLISIALERDLRDPIDYKEGLAIENSRVLTSEQRKVIDEIQQYIIPGEYSRFLLKGVTGSGKTEVYLNIIDKAIAQGKDCIVLVPEISLTPQTVERFVGRFGDKVAVLHSRLSQGERHDQWLAIAEGRVKIVVGARSAVFAPFKNLGMIIIDEEHESTYKSESKPKYNALDIASKRCELKGGVLVLGSATPSIESYYKALKGEFKLAKMDYRVNNISMPRVDIIDMRNELANGNRSIFSNKLIEDITYTLASNKQAILFVNRRGFANFVSCRDCGIVVKCKNCDISLTYHYHGNYLVCHYCGYKIKSPECCPDCKGNNIRQFGLGTQRVEKEISTLFPGSKIARMDLDTTSTKGAHQRILGLFSEGGYDILIGTQMISKGLDFPNVTLVGVISGDLSLNLPDFRASERTFQLLTQVAGRAGRASHEGKVIIQTYQPEHYSIMFASNHDYEAFTAHELKLRKEFNYPPFYSIGNVIVSSPDEKEVIHCCHQVADFIKGKFTMGSIEVYGPSSAPLLKIKRKFRWQVVIKSKEIEEIKQCLIATQEFFKRNFSGNNINLSIDINPLNLL